MFIVGNSGNIIRPPLADVIDQAKAKNADQKKPQNAIEAKGIERIFRGQADPIRRLPFPSLMDLGSDVIC